MDIEDIYYKKYLKYKKKYLELKQSGGKYISDRRLQREENNDNYFFSMRDISDLLRQILNSLVPEDIPKDIPKDSFKTKVLKYFTGTKTSTDTSTKTSTNTSDDVLKSIKVDFKKSWGIYYQFYDNLQSSKGKDTYKDYLQGYKKQISDLEIEIKNKISSIKDKEKLHSYETIINNKLKSFKEEELNTLKLNKDEVQKPPDQVGLKFLEKIIDYYFKKINEALDNAIPKWRSTNNN